MTERELITSSPTPLTFQSAAGDQQGTFPQRGFAVGGVSQPLQGLRKHGRFHGSGGVGERQPVAFLRGPQAEVRDDRADAGRCLVRQVETTSLDERGDGLLVQRRELQIEIRQA